MSLDTLKILMRRAVESDDLVTAQALAVEIDAIEGEPPEDDHTPAPTETWGTDR